ncbi:porin [Hydrogenophaga sp.]|jgi:predicted porin|uniref:porin n=1 Tax=Hydrogenophaga sp. TaxID=1904254 RepID=UPI00272FD0A7|nr:porin [Hydrogenophaga sp.]MDP2073506.1 porin [Hydrogenophaga sp.]MDP3109438.1 porin [Hydrogenophaga sp.]
MKKSLVTLAVLGSIAGIAQAQSSVQLYGIVDAYVGSVKSGLGNSAQTELSSGGLNASRWGVRGSEDLGGGLKANFNLEAGFNVDTGTMPAGFSRASWVGLSGGFGEFQWGYNTTSLEDISGMAFSSFDSILSAEYYVFRSVGYTPRRSNTFKYISPSFGGFSASGTYSLDENNAVKADTASFNLQYASGPLYVGLGYQDDGAIGPDPKYTRLGASYDFGAFKLLSSYGHTKLFGTPKTNDFSIGADFPLSSALTLSGGYAYSKDDGGAKRDGFSLSALYAVSKRTALYGGLMTAQEKNGGAKTDEDRIYAVGVRHAF